MSIRDEIISFIREYYDAGHIVNLNADVMANKLADRIEHNNAHSILQIYTYVDLARVILEVNSVDIQPAGLVICVNPPHKRTLMTHEQLADSISITEHMLRMTPPNSQRFNEISRHLTELLQIQLGRAK